MSGLENTLDTKCTGCGAPLTLDLDNLQKFCPYCGSQILVDPVAFKEILIEKEKTKRIQMEYEQDDKIRAEEEARRPKRNKLMLRLAIIGGICFIVGPLIMNLNESLSLTGFVIGAMGYFLWIAVAFLWISGLKKNKEE